MALTLPVLRRADPRIACGLAGLALAVALRVVVAGADGARSIGASVMFGLALAGLAAATRSHGAVAPRARSVAIGIAGALVLCVPAALRHADGLVSVSAHGYLPWALAVVLVAVAEEAVLRGGLYAALYERAGTSAAIAVTSLAFALLHVPLYGWGALPLDLAVGVWLGALRAVSGSVTAPAIAHTLADLAGWWLR